MKPAASCTWALAGANTIDHLSWFRRPKQQPLAERLTGGWHCAGCDDLHVGIMSLAAFAPDPWPHGEVREINDALRLDVDFLSEDFCVLEGSYFFVRAVLEIPVHGLADKFSFGCWSTLSRENFDKYLEGFNDAGTRIGGRGPDGFAISLRYTLVQRRKVYTFTLSPIGNVRR